MKLDLYKVHKSEYVAPKKPLLLKVKPAQYLAIEGHGKGGDGAFQAAIGVLYNVAFTVKMARKFAGKQDYGVCKLECLWSSQEDWQLMIRTPDFTKVKDLEQAQENLLAKGKDALVRKVKLTKLAEGTCIQMLHVGPYDKVCDTLGIMGLWAREQQKTMDNYCHEIYLSDPRRVAPAKLKTILRRALKR
jgi:hypothetical protein